MTQNIFALFEPQDDADVSMVKCHLAIALISEVRKRGLNGVEAAKLIGVHQPRMSNLMRGKLRGIGVESLILYLSRIGKRMQCHHDQGKLILVIE